MIILDRLLVGGIKFVLGKVASAVDAELNDEGRLQENLLAAQMRLELGEISEEEFKATEREILARMGELRRAKRGGGGAASLRGAKVVGAEIEAAPEIEK
jgi:hypothetical protein